MKSQLATLVALTISALAHADPGIASGSAAIAAALHGSHRSPGAADRDRYRHPVETLAFFGFTPTMTVLDVGPGTGYYTELLAPVLAKNGLYVTTNREPPSTAAEPSPHHWSPYEGVRFDALLRAAPQLYGKVQVIRVDYEAPKLNLDGQLDMVLLMREIHRALRPNGILGVEEHRAAPGTNAQQSVEKGYLPEAWVIEKIKAAGFAFVGKSEINANAKDTKDYPNGVWTLPPQFESGPDYTPADARDRSKYGAIGESDRMTLKFVRVADRAEASAGARDESQVAANSFAELVFNFCAPAVSQSAGAISSLNAGKPDLGIKGPFPLSEAGTWSKSLQPRLQAQTDSMVYSAITKASGVGRFHIAYAMADGSACIVVAQDIPYVASEVLTRLRANPEYKLEIDGEPQVYSHAKTGAERSFMIVVPREPRKARTEEVLLRLAAGAKPRVADLDREAWSKSVLQTCLKSARQQSLVSASSFGEFMMERLEKSGKTAIVAPDRYPASMLFAEGKPFGCRLILSAGAEDGAKVVALWRAQLQPLSTRLAAGKPGEESYLVAASSNEEARVRITLTQMVAGLYSLAILSDDK